MSVYYNENDPFAASWLRELIKSNLIAKGDVDERSIKEVQPADLKDYTQCHFFAGIGVWSYSLRNAGWPDDKAAWTGSCPCQPFSAAGKKGGFDDARHLWPDWFRLISECRPDTIFGEQVASKDGLAWFDLVSTDLEGKGYAVGAVDFCAAGVGAPHIRQRLYFVADTVCSRTRYPSRQSVGTQTAIDSENGSVSGERLRVGVEGSSSELAVADGGNPGAKGLQRSGEYGQQPKDGRVGGALDYAANSRQQRTREHGSRPPLLATRFEQPSATGRELGDTDDTGSQGRGLSGTTEGGNSSSERVARSAGATNGFWSTCDWLPCIDGKARPVEPGTFPLAHGIANRVGLLRGYGNSLVAPQAQAFIESFMEIKK